MNAGGTTRDHRTRVAHRVRELIITAAVEAFGAVRDDVPVDGFQVLTRTRLDDPMAAVRAADLMARVAQSQRTEHALDARAAGRSWDEIGAALCVPADGERSRGEAVFEWLVEGRAPDPTGPGEGLFRTPTTWWRCGSCDQQVADRGPFESHPNDNESGHTEDCPRHRAAVAAWRADIEGGEW
ncbi:hypothetical protein [Pseudonocardia sp. KRD291]|uniref:hypothetical protein n=1 Tax=Pseudonocardia sp. KRD291 TaxID=2792007 RepID=UPI001C4A2376|nr:hypothetical protein [Pseudonocardia sp. KRD291]MBW0101643.1 hypothetical protein [Pseudonocardia sp. KRD291]